jgi:Mn-dependent DtxR family transcriptional regulator
MTFDAYVLRAMLRLARGRKSAEVDDLALRVGSAPSKVRASMRRLRASGLVEPLGTTESRLTMAGLAVAVAMLPRGMPKRGSTAARTSRAA